MTTYQQPKTWVHVLAEKQGIPLRTLEQVKFELARDEKRDPKLARSVAHLMARHGRLTHEARVYVIEYLAKG